MLVWFILVACLLFIATLGPYAFARDISSGSFVAGKNGSKERSQIVQCIFKKLDSCNNLRNSTLDDHKHMVNRCEILTYCMVSILHKYPNIKYIQTETLKISKFYKYLFVVRNLANSFCNTNELIYIN